MEEKPDQVGSPPIDAPKPKISNLDRPFFSYLDLLPSLIGIDYKNNQRYVIFGFTDCIIKIKEFEFYSYINNCLTESEVCKIENKECDCDICEPDFIEETGEQQATIIDIETNKETPIKVYICNNLIENTKFSIHENHKDEGNNR